MDLLRLQEADKMPRLCFFLPVMLLFLSGCALQGKTGPETPSPSASGPSIARLEDGRQGFAIHETPHIEDAVRRDFEQAVALMDGQDYEQAIALLEKVIAQAPGVTAPYINIAMAYRRTGQPEKAEAHLQTALDLIPAHPAACNEYGLLYRQSGRFADARQMYETALASFPEYYPLHRNLGILCDLYLNDPACALAHYEIYGQAYPEDRKVQMWIADLRMRLGE